MKNLWVGLLALAACAAEVKQRPAEQDPASPDAPEAALPNPAAWLSERSAPGVPPEASPEAQHPHDQPAERTKEPTPPEKTETLYRCPMHPEVQSPKPGRCPKCGMALVPGERPKQRREGDGAAPQRPERHEHDHGGGNP